MFDVNDIVAKLSKLKRDRELVKSSIVSDAAKQKLLDALDAQLAVVSAQLEGSAQAGAGGVTGGTPGAPQKGR